MASTSAVAALNSKFPSHAADLLCKLSSLACEKTKDEGTLAAKHAIDSVELGSTEMAFDKSVQTVWVTTGMKTTEITNDQDVLTKDVLKERKARQKRTDTKEGAQCKKCQKYEIIMKTRF